MSFFRTSMCIGAFGTLIGLVMPVLAASPQGDSLSGQLRSSTVVVNTDNFVRAETAAQFDRMIDMAGEVNKLTHVRQATPLDQQNVIRMNRDTLYSFAIVNISKGATLVMPDAGTRYMSAMIVNEDHYINKVFYGGGSYDLTLDEFDTPYVLVALRTLVDASDPEDVKVGNALQDQVLIEAGASERYHHPNYEDVSYDAIYELLLKLSNYMPESSRTFGTKEAVDPVRHMLGTAFGWGGLAEQDAYYLNVNPNLPVGEYQIVVQDVPVEAFWSISMYNKDGYFQQNALEAYSINNLTGQASDDGSINVNLGGCEDQRANCLPLTEGWNYVVRLYRPRAEVLDGRWEFPEARKIQ